MEVGGKCLGDGSSQTAMRVLEFRQEKKELEASVDTSLVPVPHCGATLSAPAAHPLAKLEGRSPLNLNIRSLWFEALGCSAPNVDLKGKHDSSVAIAHHKITPHGKLVSAVLARI